MTSDQSGKFVVGAAWILAPVLLLSSTVIAVTSEALGSGRGTGVAQIYAGAAFGVALFGYLRIHGSQRPGLATAVTIVGAFGVTGMVVYGVNSVYVGVNGFDLNESSETAAFFALQLPGLLFPLTMVLLGLLAVRTLPRATWCGFALIAAGLLFPVSRIGDIELLAVAVDSLFVIAMVPVGLLLLRERSVADGVTQSNA